MIVSETKALFIVSSPFQAVCAIEAADRYKIDFPVFVVLYGQQQRVNSNTYKILKDYGFSDIYELAYYSFLSVILKTPKDLGKLKISKYKYDYVFLGDFFNLSQRVFSSYCVMVKDKSKFVFLDDGNSTIEALEWGLNNIRYRSVNLFIKTFIADIYFQVKGISPKDYFSIFKLKNKDYDIISNNLSYLRNSIKESTPSNTYILGSNFLHFNLLSEADYLNYLEIMIKDIKTKHPNQKIYYCPHRGEEKLILKTIKDHFNIDIYIQDSTIELDFVLKNIYPVAIYSFVSTASYSLKILLPTTCSYVILPKTSNKKVNRSYDKIVRIYEQNNIVVLN